MRNTRESAEIIEVIAQEILEERRRKMDLGLYDKAQLPGIIYAKCKAHDCKKLFEHILKIMRDV